MITRIPPEKDKDVSKIFLRNILVKNHNKFSYNNIPFLFFNILSARTFQKHLSSYKKLL